MASAERKNTGGGRIFQEKGVDAIELMGERRKGPTFSIDIKYRGWGKTGCI